MRNRYALAAFLVMVPPLVWVAVSAAMYIGFDFIDCLIFLGGIAWLLLGLWLLDRAEQGELR